MITVWIMSECDDEDNEMGTIVVTTTRELAEREAHARWGDKLTETWTRSENASWQSLVGGGSVWIMEEEVISE